MIYDLLIMCALRKFRRDEFISISRFCFDEIDLDVRKRLCVHIRPMKKAIQTRKSFTIYDLRFTIIGIP